MTGSLGVVQALQRASDTVAARQRRPAAFLLVLQETQGVRLHRLWDQTGKGGGLRSGFSKCTSRFFTVCGVPLMCSGSVAWSLPGLLFGERDQVWGLHVGRAAGRGLGAVDAVS